MKVVDVAVAIVTYRSARLTIECLRSISAERSMSVLDIRAIVVDNASGDAPSIAEAIAENGWWSWVTLVTAPKNGGFAYGNNVALQHACRQGPPRYLHMLNPDRLSAKGRSARSSASSRHIQRPGLRVAALKTRTGVL